MAWQNLENSGMKAALGMPKSLTGVLITKTEPLAHANKVRAPCMRVRMHLCACMLV